MTPFFHVILIQRGLFREGSPPLLERLVTLLNKNVIYYYDDALHLFANGYYRMKVKRARVVITGNLELAKWAKLYNEDVRIIETCVDTDNYYKKKHFYSLSAPPIIGWVGTAENLRHIRAIEPALFKLQASHNAVLRVVCSKPYVPMDANLQVEFVKWSLENEVENILPFDVGIMPLEENEFTKGKQGFKLKQYMACGIPSVCSPVGYNKILVTHGETGFWATSCLEWYNTLKNLLEDENLRRQVGVAGWRHVDQNHSLRVVAPKMVELVRSIALGSEKVG